MSLSVVVQDPFNRTVVSGWGVDPAGHAWSNFTPNTEYNVTPGAATMTLASVGSTRQANLAVSLADLDVTVPMKTGALAVGGYIGQAVMLRRADANNYIFAELRYFPNQSIDVAIVQRVAGIETEVAAQNSGLLHVANTNYTMRVSLSGTSVAAKAWMTGTPEPTAWTVHGFAATITAANPLGMRGVLASGNTNTLPVTLTFGPLTATTGSTPLGFIYPTDTDPLCGTGLPVKTALQQLADSAQDFITAAGLDAIYAENANGMPRAVVSVENVKATGTNFPPDAYTTVELNVGTRTDLAIFDKGVLLTPGFWLVFMGATWDTAGNYAIQPLFGQNFPQAQIAGNAQAANNEELGGGVQSLWITRTADYHALPAQWALSGNFTSTAPTMLYGYTGAIWLGDNE